MVDEHFPTLSRYGVGCQMPDCIQIIQSACLPSGPLCSLEPCVLDQEKLDLLVRTVQCYPLEFKPHQVCEGNNDDDEEW